MEDPSHSAYETIQNHIVAESIDETNQRLHFVATPSVITGQDTAVYQVATRGGGGGLTWQTQLRKPLPSMGEFAVVEGDDLTVHGVIAEALAATEADSAIKEKISQFYRWWDTDLHDYSEDIRNRLDEVITLSDGERSTQVVNMSGEAMSEDELAELQQTFQAVANFTGGKIFDRIKGIALRRDDRFDQDAAGAYWKSGNVVSINLENSRSRQHALNDRYKPYFDEKNPPSRIALILAHELGHAMDIDLYKDTDDSDLVYKTSRFDDKFGWALQPGEGDEKTWAVDEASQVECYEPVPTDYAAENNPAEDFAETFALLALGVDKSRLPQRAMVLAEAIEAAAGQVTYGPFQISATRADELKASIPDNIYVVPYVQVA
jgi:hypothetical protein